MRSLTRRPLILSAAVASATLTASWLFAGPLNPPAGPVAPTYKTLSEVEPRTPLSQATTPGDATNLFIITQPGSYYLTSETIGPSAKNGIRITTSNVTIDLNGFRLVGSAGSLNGIVLPVSGQRNITVKNGFVAAWGQLGIDLNLVRNCIVRDVQVVDSGGSGVHLGDCGVIAGCVALANGSNGFIVGQGGAISSSTARQNAADGFNTGAAGTLTGCSAVLNGRGIFASFGSTVTECSAYDNETDGISVASGATVARCSARANGEDGIAASTACSVRDNVCTSNAQGVNGGAGIHIIGGDSRIEGNNCSAQTRGIDVDGPGNIITRNTCSGNTTNWDIVAANAVGPIVQATTNAAAITGNTYAGALGSTDPSANFTY